jgi:hypothetical protein
MTVSAEMMIIMFGRERRLKHGLERVESPAERAVENSVIWNESERVKPRVPIPISAPLAWSPRAPFFRRVKFGRINIGFRQISGSQTAPAIQVVLIEILLIEFFCP